MSKDRIAEALLGVCGAPDANAVKLPVSRLRRKLAGAGVEIRIARGLGYMLDDGGA